MLDLHVFGSALVPCPLPPFRGNDLCPERRGFLAYAPEEVDVSHPHSHIIVVWRPWTTKRPQGLGMTYNPFRRLWLGTTADQLVSSGIDL